MRHENEKYASSGRRPGVFALPPKKTRACSSFFSRVSPYFLRPPASGDVVWYTTNPDLALMFRGIVLL